MGGFGKGIYVQEVFVWGNVVQIPTPGAILEDQTCHTIKNNKPMFQLKGTSGRKKSYAQMKEREKCQKTSITDLNAPNGCPFQSQEFEQYGRRHFEDF